jgi:alpha-galactosidase
LEVWAGKLAGNSHVVLLFNRGFEKENITANWKDIGISPGISCKIRDLWQQKDIGIYVDSFTGQVPSHGVQLLKLNPIK